MNDFKEYSAAFHDRQNELMHYGVPGMKWDPSKKKKNGQKQAEDKKNQRIEKEREAVNSIRNPGIAIAKAVYDAVPKKSDKITGSLKDVKFSAKKAPSEPTKEELLAKKKKRRGKYKRGTYAERSKA